MLQEVVKVAFPRRLQLCGTPAGEGEQTVEQQLWLVLFLSEYEVHSLAMWLKRLPTQKEAKQCEVRMFRPFPFWRHPRKSGQHCQRIPIADDRAPEQTVLSIVEPVV